MNILKGIYTIVHMEYYMYIQYTVFKPYKTILNRYYHTITS